MADRLLSDSPMHVAPAFVGRRIASPTRRFVAFGIDYALLLLPTIIAALVFAGIAMRVRERPAWDAVMALKSSTDKTPEQETAWLAAILPMLIRAESRGIPADVEHLVEEGQSLEAAERIKDFNISVTLTFSEEGPSNKLPPKTIQLSVSNLIPSTARGIALFLVPALYFMVLTRTRRGATIGKRIVGIQVVRLDGHQLSWLESFERFVAYLHIPATLFIGLVDLWHDPNRRMAHDRAAHTAVLQTNK